MKHFLIRCLVLGSLSLSLSVFAAPNDSDQLEKKLAACSACHGDYGFGKQDVPTIPRLAEKPAGYLYKQMVLFKHGDREHKIMNAMLRFASDDYLRTIAKYYAEQRVPVIELSYPEMSGEQVKRAEQLIQQGDLPNGILSCQQCHGEALTGVKPMIPGILNQPYEYTVAQLNLWRKNSRPVKSTYCMWVIANRMSDADVKAVAAWLAAQPLPENREPVDVDKLPEALPDWCNLEETGVEL